MREADRKRRCPALFRPLLRPTSLNDTLTLSSSPRAKPWHQDFILLAATWGASFLFMRTGVVEFGAIATAGVRVAIAAAFLLPLVMMKGLGPQLRQHWRLTFLVGLTNSAIPFACFSFALLSITTGLSSILNATVPLFGAIVAWLWLKDKPSSSRIAGLVIGFVGVALLAGDKASFKSGGSGWAVLACLCATLCYAIAASYTRRYLTGVPPMATATGSQIGAAVGLALPAAWLWPVQMPSLHAWGAMVLLASSTTFAIARSSCSLYIVPQGLLGVQRISTRDRGVIACLICSGVTLKSEPTELGISTTLAPASSASGA